jgi:PKD repeat protein
MKKTFTLIALLTVFLSSFSQITYNISDVPAAVSSQRVAQDTFPLPSINFGSKGTNQVYDFSNLTLFRYDTVEFRTPTSGQLSTCPSADVATTTDGINFILTNTDNANNKLTLEGFEGQLTPGNTLSAAYSTKPDLFRFPTNYLNTFSGTGYLQKTVPGSQVGQPLATSVELTISTTYTDTIDGWGKVITPVGAYKCLRKQRKETTNTVIRALVFGFWQNVSNTTATTIRYTYVTKEAKGSVINFNYDTANVLQSVNWSMVPPNAPIADFSFVVGANGSVVFTDLSDNYPTSWSWNFGDGSAVSTQQNPTHVFAANGTYNVCLTATNAGGSSTAVCKQVTITGIAVAPVADFNWVNTSGGLVNFTDQSTNTPTSWAWTFGDGGTSALQNPGHVYSANNTYNVCLTATNGGGSNQHCENVVVTGISAANNAPVANTDTVTLTQATSVTAYHVASNDLDPDNDVICLTSVWGSPYVTEQIGGSCDIVAIAPDSTFVGTDTAYYQLCDNGSPVLCDTGLIIFTVVADPNLLPVASFTFTAQVCQGVSATNTSVNYNSLIWSFRDFTGGYADTMFTTEIAVYGKDGGNFEVCLTVTNQFGSSTKCDSTPLAYCLSINEISLSNIQLYPNPSSSHITIDMSRNDDEATRNYSAIEVYNAVGAKVKTVNEKNQKLVTISVADLAEGIYLATLVDTKGTRRALGRFTVSH